MPVLFDKPLLQQQQQQQQQQSSGQKPLLQAINITKSIGGNGQSLHILNGIDLAIGAGEYVALVGPSGSGKSSLLHILGGLDRCYEGEVSALGQCYSQLNERSLASMRNSKFGFVFQNYNLIGHLTAIENVMLSSSFSREVQDTRHDKLQALKLLQEMGLEKKASQRPDTMSGGERQRVAIARALYPNPKILFCDEPTGSLDTKTAAEVIKIFTRLSKEQVAILLVTHDQEIAKGADRVLYFNQGRIIKQDDE